MSTHKEEMERLILERDLLGYRNPGVCEQCGETVDVVVTSPSRTLYHWDGEGENPNRDLTLCPEHSLEHQEYWDSRWAEYYSQIL